MYLVQGGVPGPGGGLEGGGCVPGPGGGELEGGGVPGPGGGPRGCTCQPSEQNDRQVQNFTLPQTSFAGGNNTGDRP